MTKFMINKIIKTISIVLKDANTQQQAPNSLSL
jgi:hypothetical protein